MNTINRIQPMHDNVLVRPEIEAKSAGGIIIPETAQKKTGFGEVIAVGPGRLDANGDRVAMQTQVGDRVIIATYSGSKVEEDGEKLLMVKESQDILAIIRDEE